MDLRRLTLPQVIAAFGLMMVTQSAPQAADFPADQALDAGVTEGCAEQVKPPKPRSKALSRAQKVRPPSKGIYIGAYQIPATRAEFQRFRSAFGETPPIVFSFHDWYAEDNGTTTPDKTFTSLMEGEDGTPLELARYLHDNGSVLALAWAVYCCDIESTQFWLRMKKPYDHVNRILRGEHDDFIRETARLIKKAGVPIMLTTLPEFSWQGRTLFGRDGRSWMDAVDNICNEYGDPTWPDGPERVRDLFMHVIDIFREEGVKNVTWFMYAGSQYMAPGVEGESKWLHPKYFYPGDAYMDWVGQSVYFTDDSWSDRYEDVQSLRKALEPGYRAWREVTKRPQFLPEFGLTAEQSDDKTALWRKVLTADLKAMPGIKAITVADSDLFAEYFNVPKLTDSAQDLSVVKQIRQQDPYFRKKLTIGQ